MSALPKARRIITGHDADGNAIFTSDDLLSPADPTKDDGTPPDEDMVGFVNLHRTEGIPAKVQGPIKDYHGKITSLVDSDSVTCRIVDFPSSRGAAQDIDLLMHRTISLDYGVVLKGTIQCVLDNGAVKTVNEGDVVVQRGTNHAWKNVSDRNCRMLFVLTPAQAVRVEKTGEVLPVAHVKLLSQ